MPLIDCGSVLDIVKVISPEEQTIPNEVTIATLVKETLEGLKYLHSSGQIHRDIKAGNILLDKQGHVYISDYGGECDAEKGTEARNTGWNALVDGARSLQSGRPHAAGRYLVARHNHD